MFSTGITPVSITLDDGQAVIFHPLTYGDMLKIDDCLRGRILDAARKSFSTEMLDVERDRILDRAFDKAMRSSLLSENLGGGFLMTFEGLTTVAGYSIRKGAQQNWDDEKIASIMGQKFAQAAFARILAGVLGREVELNETAEGENGSRPRRKTPRRS